MTRTAQDNAVEFGALVKQGKDVRLALLVACSVEKGKRPPKAISAIAEITSAKMGAETFAQVAGVSGDRVLRHLDAWDRFVKHPDVHGVPQAADLAPDDALFLVLTDEQIELFNTKISLGETTIGAIKGNPGAVATLLATDPAFVTAVINRDSRVVPAILGYVPPTIDPDRRRFSVQDMEDLTTPMESAIRRHPEMVADVLANDPDFVSAVVRNNADVVAAVMGCELVTPDQFLAGLTNEGDLSESDITQALEDDPDLAAKLAAKILKTTEGQKAVAKEMVNEGGGAELRRTAAEIAAATFTESEEGKDYERTRKETEAEKESSKEAIARTGALNMVSMTLLLRSLYAGDELTTLAESVNYRIADEETRNFIRQYAGRLRTFAQFLEDIADGKSPTKLSDEDLEALLKG